MIPSLQGLTYMYIVHVQDKEQRDTFFNLLFVGWMGTK